MLFVDERTKKVNEMEEMIVECLGVPCAFDAVLKALSYQQKEEIYSYIIRCYDLEGGF